jgi:syntaxin 5
MVDGLQTVFAEAASDFKKVLQQRTESMKEQTDFQKHIYDYNGSVHDDNPMPNMSALSALPPVYSSSRNTNGSSFGTQGSGTTFPTLDLTSSLMTPGHATGSSLPRPHGIAYGGDGGGANEFRQRRIHNGDNYGQPGAAPYSGGYGNSSSTPLTPLDIQRMEEETGASLMMQLIPDQDYLQQRADAMSTVESNIVELGTIFNKLAVMVSEHREMVQRVDDNVQDANTNINLSLNVLTDALTNLRTNRMLALRIFSVLVLFIIMFVIFLA